MFFFGESNLPHSVLKDAIIFSCTSSNVQYIKQVTRKQEVQLAGFPGPLIDALYASWTMKRLSQQSHGFETFVTFEKQHETTTKKTGNKCIHYCCQTVRLLVVGFPNIKGRNLHHLPTFTFVNFNLKPKTDLPANSGNSL